MSSAAAGKRNVVRAKAGAVRASRAPAWARLGAEPPGLEPLGRLTRLFLLGLAAGGLAVVSGIGAAAAEGATVGAPGEVAVSAGPVIPKGSPPSSYFQLTLAPGTLDHESVRVADPEDAPSTVVVLPANGATATNSGDAYSVSSSPAGTCQGASCWVSGLPATVTVPAHGQVLVPFGVEVPPGTASGEYLAGVVVRPPSNSSTSPGSGPGLRVGATVAPSVAIGVAITVPGPLGPLLTIPRVSLGSLVSGYVPQVLVVERNEGNAWLHPEGTVMLSAGGKTFDLPVKSDTVLPGDHATLPVTLPGVPGGAHPVKVTLWYWHHTKEAIWRGSLTFSALPRVKANGSLVTVVESPAVPPWIWVIVGVGGTLLLILLVLFLVWRVRERRRRREEGEEGSPSSEPAEVANEDA